MNTGNDSLADYCLKRLATPPYITQKLFLTITYQLTQANEHMSHKLQSILCESFMLIIILSAITEYINLQFMGFVNRFCNCHIL